MPEQPAIWFPAIKTNTGTDIYTLRLIKGLHARGIKAEVSWLPLRAEYAPWTVPVIQAPSWANIVHVNTWLHSRFIPNNLPLVTTVHHSVHHPDAGAYKGLLRSLYHRHWVIPTERQILRKAQAVIAVSQFVAETTRKTLLDVPMDVIYNGIDANIFRPALRQRKTGKPFRLLYVGSWRRPKGVDLLAPIMRDLGDDFELLYTGGDKANKEMTEMPGNMHNIGRLDGDTEVAKAMQQADALLFTSRSEGFGLVAAEAMACHLPVIATRSSSLTEVVKDGVTGILCPPDDIHAFAEAARQLSRRPLNGHSLENHVKDNFSIEQNISATLGVYHRVLEQYPKLER